MTRFRTLISWLMLSIWFGGFTFYAAVVVPLGSELLGKTEQGFVTQRVTVWLNAIGLACIAVLLWEWQAGLALKRSRPTLVMLVMLGLSSLALIVLHQMLGRLLDAETMEVINGSRFYQTHRAYLWVSILQWLLCVALWRQYAIGPQRRELQAKTGDGEARW